MDEPSYISSSKINIYVIIISFIYILIKLTLDIFLTYAYTTIPENLKYEPISICYLIYIILSWSLFIYNIIYLNCIIIYYRTSVITATYHKILDHENPFLIFKYISYICTAQLIYFMLSYNLINNIFTDVPLMYIAIKILSYITTLIILVITIIIIIALYLEYCTRKYYMLTPTPTDTSNIVNHYMVDNDTNNTIDEIRKIISNLPISTNPPTYVCALCLDANDHDTWRTLKCKHKFHPVCVDDWLLKKLSCPLCRQNV